MSEDQEARDRRAKLIGRIVLLVFAAFLAVYLLPLFVPALRPR